MSPSLVAVTGATGRLDGRVARRLVDDGVPQRLVDAGVPQGLVVRDAGRAPNLPRASVAVDEYGDAEAGRAALYGVGTLFMVSASESPDRAVEHRTVVDSAVRPGRHRRRRGCDPARPG